jgi:hypothetical protein
MPAVFCFLEGGERGRLAAASFARLIIALEDSHPGAALQGAVTLRLSQEMAAS